MGKIRFALALFAIACGSAHADLLLEALRNDYGEGGARGFKYADACTESTFVALTGNAYTYLSKLPEYWHPFHGYTEPQDSLLGGDSASLFGTSTPGYKVICDDENTFYVADTWVVYRGRIAEKKIDTVLKTGNMVLDIINDDAGARYIVTSFGLYKMGSANPLATITGDQHDFAIQDENRFIGINGHSILYFENGKVDTLKDIAGKGYLIYTCIRVPGGYVVVDEKERAYFFDPIAKAVKRLTAPSNFSTHSRNGHVLESTPFGNSTLISSGSFIFSLENGDSSIVQERLRNYADSSLMESADSQYGFINSISHAKSNRNIYLAGDNAVFRLRGRIPAIPVALHGRKSQSGKAAGPTPASKAKVRALVNGRRVRSAGPYKVFPATSP